MDRFRTKYSIRGYESGMSAYTMPKTYTYIVIVIIKRMNVYIMYVLYEIHVVIPTVPILNIGKTVNWP